MKKNQIKKNIPIRVPYTIAVKANQFDRLLRLWYKQIWIVSRQPNWKSKK